MIVWAISDPHLSLNTDKPMDVFGARWTQHHERMAEAWHRHISPEDWIIIPGDISWAMTLEESKRDLAFLQQLPGQKILSRGNHDYWWTSMKKMGAFCVANGFDSLHFMRNNTYLLGDILLDERYDAGEGVGLVPRVDQSKPHLLVCGTRGWIQPTDNAWTGEQDAKILSREVGRLKRSLDAAQAQRNEQSTLLAALHYPPFTRQSPQTEMVDLLKAYRVDLCAYGHVHGIFGKRSPEGIYDGIQYINVASDHLNFSPMALWSTASSVATCAQAVMAE